MIKIANLLIILTLFCFGPIDKLRTDESKLLPTELGSVILGKALDINIENYDLKKETLYASDTTVLVYTNSNPDPNSLHPDHIEVTDNKVSLISVSVIPNLGQDYLKDLYNNHKEHLKLNHPEKYVFSDKRTDIIVDFRLSLPLITLIDIKAYDD